MCVSPVLSLLHWQCRCPVTQQVELQELQSASVVTMDAFVIQCHCTQSTAQRRGRPRSTGFQTQRAGTRAPCHTFSGVMFALTHSIRDPRGDTYKLTQHSCSFLWWPCGSMAGNASARFKMPTHWAFKKRKKKRQRERNTWNKREEKSPSIQAHFEHLIWPMRFLHSPHLNGSQAQPRWLETRHVSPGPFAHCRSPGVTGRSLSPPRFAPRGILSGLNKHRWVSTLTAKWNIPILYKHYITLPISRNWQLSTGY